MKIRQLGDRVLVVGIEEKEKTIGRIIISSETGWYRNLH
jgi:co-chaperonin GroES (HSP10)